MAPRRAAGFEARFLPRAFVGRGDFGRWQSDMVWVREPQAFDSARAHTSADNALAAAQYQHAFVCAARDTGLAAGLNAKSFAAHIGRSLDRWYRVARGEVLLRVEDVGAVMRTFGPEGLPTAKGLNAMFEAHRVVDLPHQVGRPPKRVSRRLATGATAELVTDAVPGPRAITDSALAPAAQRRLLSAARRALASARQHSVDEDLSSNVAMPSHITTRVSGRASAVGTFGYEEPNIVTISVPENWVHSVDEQGDRMIDGHLVLDVTARDDGGRPSEVIVMWPLPDVRYPELLAVGWAQATVDHFDPAGPSLLLERVLGY